MFSEFYFFFIVSFLGLAYGNILELTTNRTEETLINPKNVNVSKLVANSSEQTINSTNRTSHTHIKDRTHDGREIVEAKNYSREGSGNSSNILDEVNNSSISVSKQIESSPKYDMSSEKNDGKPIVPKKGVTNEHFISVTEKTQNNITLSKLNEHYNQNLLKGNDAKQTEKENIEKINRSSNFVLPIVAIGVSIPLIGLLVIGFYKCGAEWWQHRHYRRMDFLIDGMYNN